MPPANQYMHAKTQKYLYDISRAAERIDRFCRNKAFENYATDDQLRSAVERQFEIIGEALNQLAKIDPSTISRVTEYRHIIAFRNVLIHGYADVDDRLVWDMIQTRLPTLRAEIDALASE